MSIEKAISRSFWLSTDHPSVDVALTASVEVGPGEADEGIGVKAPDAYESWWTRDGVSYDGEVSEQLWNRGLYAGCHEGIFNVRFPDTSSATLHVVFTGLALSVNPFSLNDSDLARLSRKFRLISEDLIDDLLSEALAKGLFIANDSREWAIGSRHLDDSTAIDRILRLDPDQMSFEEYVRQVRAIVAETGAEILD